MENNIDRKELLSQLEALAQLAASSQAQIAREEAEHIFRTLLQSKISTEMRKAAQETYYKLLGETQAAVEQFALKAASRTLDVESQTLARVPTFDAPKPEFATFGKALSAERESRSFRAKLSGSSLLGEKADIMAAHSMGMPPDEIALEVLGSDDIGALAQVNEVIARSSESSLES